ncbi:MAG: hypothetical protein WD226_08300 [Planctomycetota bacterium]
MEPKRTERSLGRGWGLVGLVALVLASTAFRVQRAWADPAFERFASAPADTHLWKSDPALLAYFVERIADAGGGVPDDWRADPRVGHPAGADVPVEFTVAQEWPVAWAWLAVGRDVPLEIVALITSSLLASLALLGAAWAVLTWTRSWGWALFAAALFVLLPANQRTLGFLLMREDLAWPLFALHFGALAAALSTRRAREAIVAGVLLAGALATWHASRGFWALELVVLAGVFLVRGAPARRVAWTLVFVPALWLVPALAAGEREWGALVASVALALSGFVPGLETWRRRLVALVAVGACVAAAAALASFGDAPAGASFEHVSAVLRAKLAHFGQRPSDPALVPFEARLLWQGPFESVPLGALVRSLGLAASLALVALAARCWRQRCAPRRDLVLGAAVLFGALFTAHLIGRTVLLAAWLVPVATTILLARSGARRRDAAVLLGAQVVAFALWSQGLFLSWYLPAGKPLEYARLFEWVAANVPPDAAVASDFVNATALLQATGNPIVLHPKYETKKSRRAAEEFFQAFYAGTPAELAVWCRRQGVEHLWIDRYVLGFVAPWVGGVPEGAAFPPESAAALFLSQDQRVLESVAGFELLYRSPPSITQQNGAPYDLFRWYRLTP